MAGIEVSVSLSIIAAVELTVDLLSQTEIVKQKTKKKAPPPK